MRIELAQKTAMIEILPWSNEGFGFKSLELTEQVGDKIASGEVTMTILDGNKLKPVLEQDMITINYIQNFSNNSQIEYKINGYIYSRRLMENELIVKFIASPNKEFSTKSVVEKYKDMDIYEIISHLYPGEKKIIDFKENKLEPDVKDKVDSLDQNGLTNLDFCYRLMRSYRKDSIYALGLEGLMIRDVDVSKVSDRSKVKELIGESDSMPIDRFEMSYFKEMDLKSEDKEASENIQPRMYGFKYALTKKDFHSNLLDIYQYNTRYLTTLKSKFKLRFLTRFPEVKLGDFVRYTNKHKINDGNLFIITWVNIRIDMNKIEFECDLCCPEDTKLP